MGNPYAPHRVVRKEREAPGVYTLELVSSAEPRFLAGQFVTVALPGHSEAKSYSLSGAPGKGSVAITVREAGAFSQAITAHEVGDTLELSPPLGYFFSEQPQASRLWLAGGIGIAPFMSMLRGAAAAGDLPPTLLLYSNRTADDVVFRAELDALQTAHPALAVRYFITRQEPPAGMSAGRISKRDVAAALERFAPREIFICGSIGFVRDYWTALKGLGVPEEGLFTEAFF